MAIRIYRESGQIRIEGIVDLIPLDQLTAQARVRGGTLNRVVIMHASQGLHDDSINLYRGISLFGAWFSIVNDLDIVHGVNQAGAITNLNTLFSSP